MADTYSWPSSWRVECGEMRGSSAYRYMGSGVGGGASVFSLLATGSVVVLTLRFSTGS
jgi:hypothetical protein